MKKHAIGRRGPVLDVCKSVIDAELATERSRCAREMPGYCQMWRRVDLLCGCCDGAYFAYYRRYSAPTTRFAGCSSHNECGCTNTLGRNEYLNTKHHAVLAVLADREPPTPCAVRKPGEKRSSRANTRATGGTV